MVASRGKVRLGSGGTTQEVSLVDLLRNLPKVEKTQLKNTSSWKVRYAFRVNANLLISSLDACLSFL